jgi:hypothetical protein
MTIRSHWREIDGGEALRGSRRKLNFLQVVSLQSLRIVDLARSIDQWFVLISLQTSIFALRGLGWKLNFLQVVSLQSLVDIELQEGDTCQVISYSGRKQE